MRKLLFLLLSVGLFSSNALAETEVLGSWLQKSTDTTFIITSEGKNYFVTHKFPSGETKTYKLTPVDRPASGIRGAKFQRKDDTRYVFFRQPETYFINQDGSLTYNYSAESAALLPAR
ncbi:MAG: hypothetical protein LBB66_07840 [Desulfovibrio sp.]|jgi:hypothetical protein|nr:hypothetical protein [Desulfovibrio sp.]